MGVYFLTYEYLVQHQLQGRPRQELSSFMAMMFGGTAGLTVRDLARGQGDVADLRSLAQLTAPRLPSHSSGSPPIRLSG